MYVCTYVLFIYVRRERERERREESYESVGWEIRAEKYKFCMFCLRWSLYSLSGVIQSSIQNKWSVTVCVSMVRSENAFLFF
jgi:hypothetical protein